MRVPVFFITLSLVGTLSAKSGQVSARIQRSMDAGKRFVPAQVFAPVDQDAALRARWSQALKEATVLSPNRERLRAMARETRISLELPITGGSLVLDLEQVELTSGGLVVRTASGSSVEVTHGAHYRGMVHGSPGSLAAISVFDGEVMGTIHLGSTTWVLGRFEDRKDVLHVLYREMDLRKEHTFVCGTPDATEPYHADRLQDDGGERTVRCVRYYWEVDHAVFLDKGSIANTTTYATGLFNQSAALFDNDGIDVTLSELFIWDVPSPYTGPSSGNFLTQFGTYRTTFNGDLAHLISYGGGGGVAWVNTICSSSSNLRMAYSGINSGYSNVPTYSWSVEVTTHEAGHNLGSSHTHACVWNGNGTSIDGCGPTAGYTEGSCATGPLPSGGGTVMSYCHLVGSVGINFNFGFGPQPAAVIRNAVNAATCLGVCGSTCDAPGTLNVTNLLITTATLTWSNVGATSYDLQWRAVGAPSWNTVAGLTTNTYALSGLVQGTAYEFQVRSNCSTSTSAFSVVRTFTTAVPCPESLEPNGTLATAAVITPPTAVTALIAAAGDQDHYRFTIASTSTINLSLYNLPYDYDLRLLSSTGTTLASSEAGGTASEFINYANAAPGTYYAYVFGYNGAFSGDLCYTLNVSSYASEGCGRPVELAVANVVYNGAQASWMPVQGANSYDLRWRAVGAPVWTDAIALTATTYTITGLAYSTLHEVQVRAVCVGSVQGTVSEYTASVNFTTAAAPCEVAPPIVLPLKVVLDGAYRAAGQLMVDSLRDNGLLPLQEPYTALGYILQGATSTTAQVFGVQGSDAIVDWVVVALRDPLAPATVLEARAGLLQRDGDVVDVDGTSSLAFCSPAGPYRVSVHHRNHLGAMSGNDLVLSTSTAQVDFSALAFTLHGSGALRELTDRRALWAGNCARDGFIKYSGSLNDRDAVLTAIGGTVPTNTVAAYRLEDVNLDGVVKYSGSDNDRDRILGTIGGVVSTNTVAEQLP
ncbi:MAG: fibronectin type III domain-containing protein [Flavobacteriales bacterium]|nr:fibronectin type III domain-containing protein [Flavobacteriales bacterium]